MKCRVMVSHLRIEAYDEHGDKVLRDGKIVEVTHRRGDIIDLPADRAKRLGNSVALEAAPTPPPIPPVVPMATAKPPRDPTNTAAVPQDAKPHPIEARNKKPWKK